MEPQLPGGLVTRRDWVSAQQLDLLEELGEAAAAAKQRVAPELGAPFQPGRAITLVGRRWRHVLWVQVPQRRVLLVQCGELHGHLAELGGRCELGTRLSQLEAQPSDGRIGCAKPRLQAIGVTAV